MHPELGEELVDLGQGRHLARIGARRSIGTRRKIGAVDRVRRGVVHRDRLRVPDDLDVARVRLELEAAAAVVRRPQAAGGARHECGPDLTYERAGGEQVVRELDPSRDSVRRVRGQRIVDRLVERLRRRSGAASACGDRDCRASACDREHGDDENDQFPGRESAQVPHGCPFSCWAPSFVPADSETSLRAGSSIVTRGPSA